MVQRKSINKTNDSEIQMQMINKFLISFVILISVLQSILIITRHMTKTHYGFDPDWANFSTEFHDSTDLHTFL